MRLGPFCCVEVFMYSYTLSEGKIETLLETFIRNHKKIDELASID